MYFSDYLEYPIVLLCLCFFENDVMLAPEVAPRHIKSHTHFKAFQTNSHGDKYYLASIAPTPPSLDVDCAATQKVQMPQLFFGLPGQQQAEAPYYSWGRHFDSESESESESDSEEDDSDGDMWNILFKVKLK